MAALALERRPQPGQVPAFFLALLVHGAFLALIVFGVAWQSSPPMPLEAELWDQLPPAPNAQPQPPPPPPEAAQPEPPKPEPVKPEPPPPPVEKAPPKPDPEAIAEKREKEKRERLEKAEHDKREKLEKLKAEEARKKREDQKKREEDERTRREAEKAREAAAAVRQSAIDRYVRAIQDKIRGKANVPDTVSGNPEVQVHIRVLPGGEVLDAQITRRSGNPAYDAAIERAIRSAQPLPVPPADSELFPQFRDLNLNLRHDR